MNRLFRLALAPVMLVALFGADTIPAEELSLHLDPAATKVEFTLGDLLHTVHGTFALRRGLLHFNPATGKISGELVVDATSGDSGSHTRDRRMHANILESERYPDVTFRPDRVDGKVAAEGKSNVEVHGVFAIHGAEHELTVPVEVDAANGDYTVTAHFQIPYVKWGMKNPSTLLLRVSDKVEITVRTVSHRTS